MHMRGFSLILAKYPALKPFVIRQIRVQQVIEMLAISHWRQIPTP